MTDRITTDAQTSKGIAIEMIEGAYPEGAEVSGGGKVRQLCVEEVSLLSIRSIDEQTRVS